MKPVWAALGIILLLVSTFLVLQAASGYNETQLAWDKDPNPGNNYNSSIVSRVLNEGDYFKLEIYPASDWPQKGMEPIGNGLYKNAFVNISDPLGAQTEFLCEFLYTGTTSTGTSNTAMIFYNITGTGGPNMTLVDPHGIDSVRFEIPYGDNAPGIVARALSNGTYTANMTILLNGGGSPPYEMKLSKGVSVTYKLDYTSLYPVGFGLFVVSAVLLVVGFRKPKATRKRIKDRARSA